MQGRATKPARRRPASRLAAAAALLLAALAPLLAPVRRPGQRIAAWLATAFRDHWNTVLIGVAAGVTYETVTEVQPLANALSESLAISPGTIGNAVCFALLGGLVGTVAFVPLANLIGHRTVQVGLSLTLVGVMLAAPLLIGAYGVAGLYLVTALSGAFGRGMAVAHHWAEGVSPGGATAVVLQAGLQLGLTGSKLLDSAVVRGTRWQPGFLSQAAALVVAALLFAWLMPGKDLRSTLSRERLLRWAAGRLTVAGERLQARAAQPRRRVLRDLIRPGFWGGTARGIAGGITPATRIVFFQQAALWAFDTYVVYLLIAKGLDESALWAVLLPVALSALVVLVARRLTRRPAITRLAAVGLVAVAWPAVLLGVLSLHQAAFVAVLFTATMGLEPGTTIWSAVGPGRAVAEAGSRTAGQVVFDLARTLGALSGIQVGGRCLEAFGPVGLAVAGCSIAGLAVWDGLLRGSARRELREELAAVLESRRERRSLPLGDAALLGFGAALGRAAFPAAAPFLIAISGAIGSGSTAWAKAALAVGPLGYALGLAGSLVRRGRMVGRHTLRAGYALAAAGGVAAAVAPELWLFALGVGLLGFGAAIPQLVQAALRERERAAGTDMAAVNSEIEVWVLPSTGALMLITAVVGYATSWRWALLFVSALVGATGTVTARWRGLPAPRAAAHRPATLTRVLRRPGNLRRAIVSGSYYGSLLAFYTPLALLLEEHGWGPRAVLVIAGIGAVRFLAPPIMRRFGDWAKDAPHAAARAAFGWSLVGGLVLLVAPLAPSRATLLVGLLAIGILIAEGTGGGGWAATKAQSDHGHDAAASALLLALAGALGATAGSLAIAPLDWGGSCVVGLCLALVAAWLSGWPALSWSTHSLKGHGELHVVTHRGPDGSAWLLAGRQGRKWKAFRLRSGEQLPIVHRADRVPFARWTASPRAGTYAADGRRELGGTLGLRRRSMRWIDADERLIGRLVWSGDDRVTVTRLPRTTLAELASRFPKPAAASWSSAATEYVLDGPDVDEPWVLRSRVLRNAPGND
jgi:predicted MFS family arabinose efflux permease